MAALRLKGLNFKKTHSLLANNTIHWNVSDIWHLQTVENQLARTLKARVGPRPHGGGLSGEVVLYEAVGLPPDHAIGEAEARHSLNDQLKHVLHLQKQNQATMKFFSRKFTNSMRLAKLSRNNKNNVTNKNSKRTFLIMNN